MAIEIGNTVEVLQRGTAARHMVGVRGRVVNVNSDGWVYVEDPTGQGVFAAYGDTTSWMFIPEHVKKVEEDLAEWEKELLGIETKQEIEAGDTVKVIDKVGGHGLEVGSTHTVKAVEDPEDGKFAMIVLDVPDAPGTRTASYAKRFELVSKAVVEAEKPKARSQEIEKHEIQKGDLIVAFWDHEGVELRRKGVAHENDGDDDWMTKEGAYLTYDDALDSAEHIYLIERPEPKPEPEIADGTYWARRNEAKSGNPVYRVEVSDGEAKWFLSNGLQTSGTYALLLRAKNGEVYHLDFHTEDPTPSKGFGALDKTKTYYLKHYAGELDWYLAFEGGEWRYGNLGNIVTRAYTFEEQFTTGESAWEKPVEYVEPPKTIQEKLDELGVKAGDTYTLTSWKGAVYQFLGGGKLRYSDTAQPNPWWTNRNVDESDLEQIVDGSFTKIS